MRAPARSVTGVVAAFGVCSLGLLHAQSPAAVEILDGGVVRLAPPIAARPNDPTSLADVLRRAAEYVAQYEHEAAAVVAEEDYLQRVSPGRQSRHLRSDLLFATDTTGSWVGFRDVFAVDDKPVRDRDQRLTRLFGRPGPDAAAQARRIAAESARFNLDLETVRVSRTINFPMAALLYLRAANQSRSTFAVDREEDVDGVPVLALRFQEQMRPRLIGSVDNAAAEGTFWVESGSGRVRGSELRLTSVGYPNAIAARILVTYAPDPKLNLWLPARMDEQYTIRNGAQSVGVIAGTATYTQFRRFDVATSSEVK
jgi:hypothetical protein